MAQREAQDIARQRRDQLLRAADAAPLTLADTQKIKNRWLVDFDSAAPEIHRDWWKA